MRYSLILAVLLCVLLGGQALAAPVALLVLTDDRQIDARYEQELTAAGYRVEKAGLTDRFSADYLRQFGVIVVSRLPFAGAQYNVAGVKWSYLQDSLALVREYLANGGGVVLEPAMSEFGEAYAQTYNAFLKPYGAAYLAQQLRDNANTTGAYAAGRAVGKHPIVKGLKDVLYPINVLRWDHAYSTTPFTVSDKAWTVLAEGKPGAGSHQALDNSNVGEQLTPHRTLFAIRPVGKGLLAVSAVHSYYTLTHAYSAEPNLGENNTGKIDGITLNGEAGGRASDFGKLLDATYRALAANTVKNGLGTGTTPFPEQAKAPAYNPVIDWKTITPPPTWRHRVQQVWLGDRAYYDELPDPAITGDLQYYKALVGPRTAASSGTGTVAEYKAAAQAAGYSAIFFAETLTELTKEKWEKFVQECDANSDDTFACLPGLDLYDFQGGHYLVLGARRYPDPTWLTPDGKRLQAVRMLSLGWFGHVATVHRSNSAALHPRMYKHFQAVSVYTYDTKGKLVDDSFATYQWQVFSDSNPIPMAAHEVTSPADVATAAATGFQQVLPASNLAQAVDYFRFGFTHYFDCPLRYFISEGPILDGWSMINKDIGKPEMGRDHWRLGIGVRGENAITEATLYDGENIANRWLPNVKTFTTLVDGHHEAQHEFFLVAKDAKGKRVLSPGIRTVTRNWRLRCGDRQNWLGSLLIYTGWHTGPITFSMPMRAGQEGGTLCPVLDFPFFSNHVQINDADMTSRYITPGDYGGDAKPTFAVRPTEYVDAWGRLTYFIPKQDDFAALRIDIAAQLKRDVEPLLNSAVYPVIANTTGKNELLILPGQAPVKISTLKAPVELPVGSYVGGHVILTPGLRLAGRQIGYPAPAADTLAVYKGTAYAASYLQLKKSGYHWRNMNLGFDGVDDIALDALALMGFRGTPPFSLALTQGTFDKLAWTADCTAKNGGIAGVCMNTKGQALLDNVPLRLTGINPRVPLALWRADAPRLDYFAAFQGVGMVPLNADTTVEFYAGNVAQCDPALFVSVVSWTADEASFRLNNPTNRDITTAFTTAPIKGYKAVSKQVVVKAGQTVEVKE